MTLYRSGGQNAISYDKVRWIDMIGTHVRERI